jgi:hypothetical protein
MRIYSIELRERMYMKTYRRKNSKMYRGAFIVAFCTIIVLFSTLSVQSKVIDGIKGETEGTIYGIVTDCETNEPIPDALLTLEYHDTVRTEYSNSQGRYIIRNVPLCFCLKNLSASKDGYESEFKMVPVYKITHVDFELKPMNDDDGSIEGVLTGYVKDVETDDPLQNTLMTLKYHDVIRFQYTDIVGHYSFDKVPICFCLKNISAHKEGYENQNQLIAISDITYANFSLEPVSNENPGDSSYIPTKDTTELENKIESEGEWYILFGMIGSLVASVIGLTIYVIRKRT